MAAHLNINSLRYKFDEIKEVLTNNIVDLLIISETKLDESFNDRQNTVCTLPTFR
jgi:exonuclease III